MVATIQNKSEDEFDDEVLFKFVDDSDNDLFSTSDDDDLISNSTSDLEE